ncbi:MAG: hypothetical protein QG604_970 [Candidatus Dependentiae bacterium]|nr:hypothetical protein [Candidatus Dependentiae bacterium]
MVCILSRWMSLVVLSFFAVIASGLNADMTYRPGAETLSQMAATKAKIK